MRTLLTPVCFLVLGFSVASCGSSTKPAPVATTSAETPVANTPTASATVPPTATPVPNTSPVSPLDALKPILMREGPPVTLPGNTILYYFGGRVPLEGRPDTLLRAYQIGSDGLVIDDLLRNIPVKGRVYGYAFDPDRQRIAITVCLSGDCFEHFLISNRATSNTVLLSDDGGVTWSDLGPPPAAAAYLVGFDGDQLLFGLPDPDAPRSPWKGTLFPVGTRIVGPPDSYPIAFEGRSIVWTTEDGGVFDQNGTVIRPAVFAPGLKSDPTGGLFGLLRDVVIAYVPHRPADHAIVETDHDGVPKRAVAWGDFDLTAVARLSPDLLLMNRYRPSAGGLGDAAILDLATGAYRPIEGLRRSTDRDAYPVALAVWPFARVQTGSDCLNVREKPTLDAPAVGCFPAGVLLRVGGPATILGDREWLPVEAPGSSAPGYAAAEFLER